MQNEKQNILSLLDMHSVMCFFIWIKAFIIVSSTAREYFIFSHKIEFKHILIHLASLYVCLVFADKITEISKAERINNEKLHDDSKTNYVNFFRTDAVALCMWKHSCIFCVFNYCTWAGVHRESAHTNITCNIHCVCVCARCEYLFQLFNG